MDSNLSITFPTTSLLYPVPNCFLLRHISSLCYTTTTNISMGLCKTHRIIPFFLPPQVATTNQKIGQVASCYLDLHACPDRSWRIDVGAVQLSRGGKPEEIRVYQHAIAE